MNYSTKGRLFGAIQTRLLCQVGTVALAAILALPAWAQQCTTNASTGVTVDADESNENSKSIHSANWGS